MVKREGMFYDEEGGGVLCRRGRECFMMKRGGVFYDEAGGDIL